MDTLEICLSVVKRSVLQMRFVNDARAANMVSILKNYTAFKYAQSLVKNKKTFKRFYIF